MSASSLVINLGEDSFNMEDHSESFLNESEGKTDDSSPPHKSSPPETLQDDDIDLPQCKIKRNYACSHCSYYTQNPRFYLYHLKNVHKEKIRIYECPSCLYASKHSQKLQRHVHMVHVMCAGKRKVPSKPKPPPKPPKLPKPPPPSKIIRTLPKEEAEEEDSFVSGMFTGDGENRNYKCSLCPFTSRSQTLVTRHERIVHLKKKFFRCIKCNYMTHMKARYTKHVKYHSMPMIKCEMCDFRTPYKWNLDRHNKNHMGDGAFKCSLCNFTADIKQSLTVHEMNHHVPPVGQATPTKRRNRVGASDTVSALEDESIDHDELELLRLEREDELSDGDIQAQISDTGIESLNHLDELEVTTKPLPPSSRPKKIMMKKPKAVAHFNTKELTVKLGEKVVNPGDVLQHKNGAVYVKKIKCRVCNYRAAWDSEMSRHELRVHGLSEKKKIPARPIPNLIPIQNKSPSQPPTPSLLIPPPPLKGSQQKPLPPQMHSSHQLQQVPHMQSHHPTNLKLHSRTPSHPQLLLQPSQSILLQPSSHQLMLQPQPHPHPLIMQSHPHQAQQMLQGQHHYHQTPPLRPSPVQPPSPHSQPPILKIPTLAKGKTPTSANTPERAMSEKDLNDICAKSCPNSSLKDFASLIGGDDAFKTSEENVAFSVGSGTSAFPIEKKENKAESVEPSGEIKKTPEAFKKKNASFFDKLKEKLMTGAGESCNLVCDVCGHESKCLSESVRHQKLHNTKISGSSSCNGGTVISGAELSSTRCQHCRQRCKTSSDLVIHLQSCMEANKKSPIHIIDDDEEDEEEDEERMDFEDDLKSEDGLSDGELEKPPHPMENKVFVWTNMSNCEEDALHDEDDSGSKSPTSESSVVGIETAPGIGAVTSKSKSSLHGTNGQNGNLQKSKAESVKKVYKCPHCSFWASTASRFHVHIVGHLNKKPFECSLCSYRSNWRWDITKHIRLKTVRDSTHERARVLMTDETGRRNYSKYNKYLTLMRVHEPSAESSGTGRRSKPLTQSYDPIETLPAPPKLTPAPLSALQSGSSNNVQIMLNNSTPPPLPPLSQRPSYSKPPPLQSSLDMKRSGQESDLEPPKKKQNVENKKTMWKCKKCLFRDSDRAVVLAHVKEHYRSQTQSVIGQDSRGSSLNELTDEAQEASALGDDAPFMCGHCHQVSNWKHVIQRHCRLKHSGDVKIIVGQPRQGGTDENSFQDNNEFMDDGENEHANGYMCETCPFVCSNQKDLDEHMECHFERPGATLKCYYCPFYVRDKMQLIDHISLHGDSDGDDVSRNLGSQQGRGSLENGESNTNKRYRCSICPYVSNSKSQFLYHKQFHRPRNAPFKCTMCSYNVTRRHLLHQHLRLHGINILIPKTKDFGFNEFEEGVDLVGTMNELDTTKMAEIPLVWVSKMGNLTKMFKCRFCPHVNIRKSNIQEHEKMHGIRIKNNNPDGSPPHPQQQHHCPDCNYICNNAGVLSSHAKVHQGLFGQVCSLVDLNRPDDVQIKELNTILGRHEEGPPEILPDEINKDFKDSSPAPQVSHNDRDTEHTNMDGKVLHFCSTCPARFLYPKELEIHTRFHNLQLQFRCQHCTYTARQQPHLLAHYKVHTDEYQDRTSSLCEVYRISNQNPKPKIAVVVDGSESAGNAWVVVPMQRMVHTNNHTTEYELDETLNDISLHGSRVIHKQFSCSKCPAKFFKTVALQYHMTLHGGPGPHKCRVCDYSVKTYGNLIKHEAVHEELEPRAKVKSKPKRASENIPTSGTELFRQKTEAAQKCAANPPLPPPPPPPLHIDPEFGILMHGSPEFIYPTYLKNGRLKEKRYKCHKCPSAFEKREQYKVHLSLHGSKQRYKCERCDYSVKYYANYIQHLRKHQSNDATKAERTISSDGKGIDELGNESTTEINDSTIAQSNEDLTNIVISRSAKKMQLSMADQQTMMLMQQRVVSNSISAPEILNRCPHCPYSNQRKDGVGSHARCHSNIKGGAFTCKHCDYTVPQQHFLREHNKLHFTPLKGMRPEAYMKCDRLELWAEPIEQTNEPVNKLLIFKDKGANFKVKRFLPDVPDEVVVNGDSDIAERTFINLKSGELEIGQGSPESPEKDDNKENKDTMYNGSVKEEGSTDETLQEKNQDEDKVEKTEENNSDSEIDNNNKIENSANNESSQESEDKIVNEEESVNGEDKSVNSEEGDDKSLNEDKSVSGDEKSVNCEDKSISEEEKQTQSKSDSEQHVNSSSSDSDSEDSSSDSSSSSDESDGESSSSSATSNHQD